MFAHENSRFSLGNSTRNEQIGRWVGESTDMSLHDRRPAPPMGVEELADLRLASRLMLVHPEASRLSFCAVVGLLCFLKTET